jgi:hypothetical protein
MRHLRFSPSRRLWLFVALLGGLALTLLTLGAARALPATSSDPSLTPGGIEGILYEPGGTVPVPYGWIDVHDANGVPWMGTDTDATGHFSIPNLPPGEYVLNAQPPLGSPYAASLPHPTLVSGGQWASVVLHLTEVRISGQVLDSDSGLPVAGASVVAHNDTWTVERWSGTNSSGEFKVGGLVTGVTYHLKAFPPPDSAYVQLPIDYTAVPITSGVILEMHIPPTNVVGIVHDEAGSPVPGSGVVVSRPDFWQETAANELGEFLFRDLPRGEFWIQAAPPWGEHGQGLLSSSPFTIAVAEPPAVTDAGVIVLPRAFKTVSGRVVEAGTDIAVIDAVVSAHRLGMPGFADTPVDANGVFTLSLPGGEWHLDVGPLPPPNPPAQWIFPGPPAWIAFQQPVTTPEQIAGVILEVIPTNAWVGGQVLCPGDPPVPCAGDPPQEAIEVELRNQKIGNRARLRGDYSFEVPIPDGWYELTVHAEHPTLQGPPPQPVFVGPGQRLQLLEPIVLLSKDARIVGRVRGELGIGIPGVHVVGWQPEGFAWGEAETDASGVYTMPVIGGEWFVEPHPGPDTNFVYRHRPRLVRVAPRGTMSGVDLELSYAGARILGAAVDAGDPAAGRLWGLDGWASARVLPSEALFSDAPLRDGGFRLKVAGGKTYAVGLDLPPQAPYVSGGVGPVLVGPGEIVTTTVPLERKNAAIEGALVIAGTSPPQPALGIRAEVFGEDERGHWVSADVDPLSAGYGMKVVSGTWHLRARVDPRSGYVAVPDTTLVTVQAGQVRSFVDFEVWPINAPVSGHVFKPDGTPLAGALVFAEGESPIVGYFETHAQADPSGAFELLVPEGVYVVGAALPGQELEMQGWLNPPPKEGLAVSPSSPATGLVFRFRQLDGEIRGAVTFAPGINAVPTHPAFVWGWSDNGEWTQVEAAVASGSGTFAYVMPIISDTVWHVGAVYEDPDHGLFYESPEAVVPVAPPGGHAIQDLDLGGPWPLPQPFIVSFDGSQMQTIVMPDGVELRIPPGAVVVSGTVTLFIFPTQEMQPKPGQEIVGAGYEIWAVDQNGQEVTQFNQNVMMTFHYPPDAVLSAQGISEQLLVPVYYSTLVGRWILADSYVVDTVQNEITLQIDHFSKFGMASTGERQYGIYLPVVSRRFP